MRRLRSSPARKFPFFPVFVRRAVVVALHVAVRVCACGVFSDALDSGDQVYLHGCVHHTVPLCPAPP
jgi:hypothetical protein